MQLAKKRKLAVSSRFGTAGDHRRIPPPCGPSAGLLTKIQKSDKSLPSPSSSQPQPQPPPQPAPVPLPALDRLEIHLHDPPIPSNRQGGDKGDDDDDDDEEDDDDNESYKTRPATLSLTFFGSDVIAGVRQLAELGVVDPARMPSWMTGEDGVSVASVKGGRRRR
ncbi:conserved hypothetical protein [Histoplasma capsulatum H143]|uniref:Uncharacterized protein n=1 Tax=Ajellomyces capsulatus (strain H143) TaxID=544712 RepID=C6H7W6_AJECH|nr:conserved hypothetical protein [Histoplasma capsulatum H143]